MIGNMLLKGFDFEFHAVGICLPAFLLALIVIGIYLKERSKKL